jgi:hypothetical protein
MFGRHLAVFLSIATWTLVANAAGEPAFPHRPIRLVTSEVGGSADIGARLLAQGLTGRLGQQVIVDNRGSGIIPGDIVSTRRGCPDTNRSRSLLFSLLRKRRKRLSSGSTARAPAI